MTTHLHKTNISEQATCGTPCPASNGIPEAQAYPVSNLVAEQATCGTPCPASNGVPEAQAYPVSNLVAEQATCGTPCPASNGIPEAQAYPVSNLVAEQATCGTPCPASNGVPEAQAYPVSNLVAEQATCGTPFAATTPAFGSLAELIPPFIRYDHRRFVLVLEYLVGSRDLVTYHRTQGLMPTEVAQEFGQKLAEVHTAGRQATAETLSAVSPPERIPWIFSIHRGDYVLSRANRQLIDLALKNEAFSLQLDELHQNWRQDTLLHGDVKWLNCLLHEAKGKTNIYLIDWEMLQLGESLWDVAGFIQSYLSEWTLQPNKERELTLDQWIERYADAIRIQHDSIHSFWSAYAQTAGLDTALTGSDFQRTLLYVAGRLFQTVYEYLSQQETLFPEAIRTLELAQRLLAKDADTIELTLGVAQ